MYVQIFYNLVDETPYVVQKGIREGLQGISLRPGENVSRLLSSSSTGC
jgi:hypothetical protein